MRKLRHKVRNGQNLPHESPNFTTNKFQSDFAYNLDKGCFATSINQIVQGVDNDHCNSKSKEKYIVDSLSFTYLVFADIQKLTNQAILSSCFLVRALQYLDGMARLPPLCPQILSQIWKHEMKLSFFHILHITISTHCFKYRNKGKCPNELQMVYRKCFRKYSVIENIKEVLQKIILYCLSFYPLQSTMVPRNYFHMAIHSYFEIRSCPLYRGQGTEFHILNLQSFIVFLAALC